LRIAGQFVQLPPDGYVNRELDPTQCPTGPACPETSLYEIVRGGSTVTIGVTTGTIYSEDLAPGEETAFDFLRRPR
jgi:hypothetical protein